MLRIGEFSRLSQLTVKALRFYEKEGILMPAATDEWTGYRYYEEAQLGYAARIRAYRQLGLSIGEIKAICRGEDEKAVLRSRAESLAEQRAHIDSLISSINHILEDRKMNYQVSEKLIPKAVVYCSEAVLGKRSDIMQWIPSVGEECLRLNPDMKCAEPPYEFCEYLDEGYMETNIRVRHTEAVTKIGKENDKIKFRELPEARVLSVLHKGSYDCIGDAYAFIISYAKEKGFRTVGLPRECYIDGVWNKESADDWLTEIQLPIE